MAVTDAVRGTAAQTAQNGSTASMWALASMEARAGVRGPAFRFLVAVSAALGVSVGAIPGPGAALSAWAAGEAAWRYFGFVVIIWMSLLAVHDTVTRTDILVYSKPQPTERIVLSRFAAAYWLVALALAALYLGALLGRFYVGGGTIGLAAYPLRYFVSLGVLFFAAAGGYSLALLARTPLAGAIVALYWLFTMAGKGFLAKAYFPAYTQNVLTYMFLGIGFLLVASWFHRRQRRGGSKPAAWVIAGAPLALVASYLALANTIQTTHDPETRTEPALDLMQQQDATMGRRTPGFRLPDSTGKLRSLADYPGRILVIGLFTPTDSDSAVILDWLEDVQREYGARGVQPIALCLSEDAGAVNVFARGNSIHYPILLDWGTHNADKVAELSPITTAYRITSLPYAIITDRSRRLRAAFGVFEQGGHDGLDASIRERLADEPE